MKGIHRWAAALLVATLLALTPAGSGAVEQGTITVAGIWPAGQEPAEAVEVCLTLTLDETGDTVVGSACVTDPYVASFGPADPPVETGHTYYAWQSLPDGTLVGGPQAVLLTDASGEAFVEVPLAPPTPIGATGTIEVHVSACPVDIGNRTLYDACHASGYAGDEIVIDGPVWQSAVTTGDLGAVRFDGLPAGTYTIAEGEMHGEFERFAVYCSAGGAEIPVGDRSNGRAAVAIALADGQEVICDWYNIPTQALIAPEPAVVPAEPVIVPETPAPAGGVTALPSTGTGPLGGNRVMAINVITLLAGAALLIAAGTLVGGDRRRR